MKRIYYIFMICLLALGAASCSSDIDSPAAPTQGETRIEVGLNVMMPLPSLPGSRAVTNESTIASYQIWVFANNLFVESVKMGDTYTENGVLYPKVNLRGFNLYVLLEEGLTNVQLIMVANHNVTSTPTVGVTTVAAAQTLLENETFSYDGTSDLSMPFYGMNDTPFSVKLGANGGTIQLIRALARVDVYASTPRDKHFTLEEIWVCNSYTQGTVKQGESLPTSITTTRKVNIKGTVGNSDDDDFIKQGTVYIPEITGITDSRDGYCTSTFVIVKGKFQSYSDATDIQDKYYRWDFIKQTSTGAGVVNYEILDKIERNHRYIFTIEYINTSETGYADFASAVEGSPENYYDKNSSTQLQVISEDEIMNITTDNYVYLGVTADNLTATASTQNTGMYWASFYVMTNNPDGWVIKYLPTGVTVTVESWVPDSGSTAVSVPVYVWIPESSFTHDDENNIDYVVVYVFSGRIRKEITVIKPQASTE